MDIKIQTICLVKEGLEKDPTNDNLLTHLHYALLNLLDDKPVLTENGYAMLYYDPVNDLEKITTQPDKIQRPLTRISLHLTIAYNLNILFVGFMSSLNKYLEFLEAMPTDLKEFLEAMVQRSLGVQETIKNLLPHFLNRLTDKYAKIYNCEKGACFTRDIFGNKTLLKLPNDEMKEEREKAKGF